MSKKEKGGAAFPQSGFDRWAPEGGMTLRDYFAAGFAASQATMTSADNAYMDARYLDPRNGGLTVAQVIAKNSYELADAMLAERDK